MKSPLPGESRGLIHTFALNEVQFRCCRVLRDCICPTHNSTRNLTGLVRLARSLAAGCRARKDSQNRTSGHPRQSVYNHRTLSGGFASPSVCVCQDVTITSSGTRINDTSGGKKVVEGCPIGVPPRVVSVLAVRPTEKPQENQDAEVFIYPTE